MLFLISIDNFNFCLRMQGRSQSGIPPPPERSNLSFFSGQIDFWRLQKKFAQYRGNGSNEIDARPQNIDRFGIIHTVGLQMNHRYLSVVGKFTPWSYLWKKWTCLVTVDAYVHRRLHGINSPCMCFKYLRSGRLCARCPSLKQTNL